MSTTLGLRNPVRPTDFRACHWPGSAVIGVANGAFRRAAYEEPLGERTAHQVLTMSAIGPFSTDIYLVDRRWPIATARDAVLIGGAWATVTAA